MAEIYRWSGHPFKIMLTFEEACDNINSGVFIFAIKEKSLVTGTKWKAHFIGETDTFQSLKSARLFWIWSMVTPLGESYIHVLHSLGENERKLLVEELINIYKPDFNLPENINIMATSYKWSGRSFEVLTYEQACKDRHAGVFIFASYKTESKTWTAYFISEIYDFHNLNYHPIWTTAREIGTTHVHILAINDELERKKFVENLIRDYSPVINKSEQLNLKEKAMANETQLTEQLNETKSKLELLYQYEKHYLELIKAYKEEIKFANSLQEDLRRERSQFFTQTLKEVVQTMKAAEVDKSVSAQWIQDLVASYTKSIDLSGDLAKTHVIEILSILTAETKKEASEAKLDNVGTNN